MFIELLVRYASFRGLARDWHAKAAAADRHTRDPLFVRLFGEVRFAGLIVMFVLFYPVLGIVMQMIWALVLIVPLPLTLTQLSVSGATASIVWAFALMWILMIISLSSPILGLLWRWSC